MLEHRFVGTTLPAFEYQVIESQVRAFAAAIGDAHPAYEAGLALPPTLATTWLHHGNPQFQQQLIELGVNLAMILHGEEEYSYLAPIRAGDTVRGVTRVVAMSEKAGRSGPLELLELETTYAVAEVAALIARSLIVIRI